MLNGPDGHDYDPEDVCTRCGWNRAAIDDFHVQCSPRLRARIGATPPPLPSSADRRVSRPLAIVSRQDLDAGVLEALLVSAADPEAVAASVRAGAAHFDPDVAFRRLDDLRSRAETVYQWVADSLDEVATVAPPPAPVPPPRSGPRRTGLSGLFSDPLRVVIGGLSTLAALAVVAGVPGGLVVALAAFVALFAGVMGLSGLAVRGGCLAGSAGLVIVVMAAKAVMDTGTQVIASRVLLGLVVVLFGLGAMIGERKPRKAAKPARALPEPPALDPALSGQPFESVIRGGEAARYVPSLFLLGARRELAVAIECEAEDGSVLRRVVLPLGAATRETAAEAVRMAKKPDIAYAAERARKAMEADIAAAAVARLDDLERSRRSLPE